MSTTIPRVGAAPTVPPVRAIPLEHVEVYHGSRGSHKLYTATGPGGVPMFAKHNAISKLRALGPALSDKLQTFIEKHFPNLDRFEDVRENLLSHIAQAHFDFPTMVYDEACFRDPQDGHVFFGLATPYLQGLANLDDHAAEEIKNPRQAVEATLVKGCLFGDWDVTINTGNTAIMTQDGTLPGGVVLHQGDNVALDYGEGGNWGCCKFNVPFGSAKVLRAFPQFIQPALDKILALTDSQIDDMVETQGQGHVTGWNTALRDYFTSLLKHNRDQLKSRVGLQPHWLDPNRSHNPLRLPNWWKVAKYSLASRGVMGRLRVGRSGVLPTLESTASIAERLETLLPLPSQTTVVTS